MRLKFTLKIFIIILAFTFPAFTQTEYLQISGRVTDLVSENELEGALVTIANLNTGKLHLIPLKYGIVVFKYGEAVSNYGKCVIPTRLKYDVFE